MDLLIGAGEPNSYVDVAVTPTLDLDAARYAYTDDGVTTALHGDPVKRWADVRYVAGDYASSGNFTQDTQVKRPIFRNNIFGSKPGIEFKTDDLLTCTGAAVSGRLTSTTYTMFIVCKFHMGTTSTQLLVSMAKSTTLNAQYRFAAYLGANWALWRTDDAGTQTSLVTGGIVDTNSHLITIQVNGASASMWVWNNGQTALPGSAATVSTGAYGTTAITSYDNLSLGAMKYNNTEGTFSDAYLGRFRFYNSVLTSTQRANIENELIDNYL